MSSIAYLSDQNMLDYHRVHGNQEIVFWRLSKKKFKDFQVGDLLFFLAKGSENARHNEKGIVGYGCFQGERQMTIDHLWKKYEGMTGYNNKDNLINAIKKTAKSDILPDTISCLFLKDVIFFQGPVYLSEIGITIPSNLESFTYLDSHEGHVTLELLQKIKEIGIDYWSAALNNKTIDMEAFDNEILRYQIASMYESMNISTIHNNSQFKKHCFSMFKDVKKEWINRDQNSFIVFGEPKVLYYIYSTSQKDNKENYIKLLGQITYISNCLKQTIDRSVKVRVLSAVEFSDLQKETLLDNNIDFVYIDMN